MIVQNTTKCESFVCRWHKIWTL